MRKKQVVLLLFITLIVGHGFSQHAINQWVSIKHDLPKVEVWYKISPKIPGFKKGPCMLKLKFNNSNSYSMQVNVRLSLSLDNMVSDNQIYRAQHILKPNKEVTGRRGGVLFKPALFFPAKQNYSIEFEVASTQSN
ncbi:MAG: hypothetical protein ACKO8Q_02390 [Bacteroidota bacterium]